MPSSIKACEQTIAQGIDAFLGLSSNILLQCPYHHLSTAYGPLCQTRYGFDQAYDTIGSTE